jgi:protein-glutamine gamma-glutamyltransferase
LGGLIFLVLPRRAGATRSQTAAPMSRHLTGFDEEVQLGQLGEILENDSVVMSVELTDDDDKVIRPVEEPLWRGVTMLRYEKGRWHRQSRPTQTVVSFQRQPRVRVRNRIHQKITLEPNDSATLFGIRPMLDARAPHKFSPHLSTNDGTLFRADSRSGEYEYEVVSDSDPDAQQPHESPPRESDKQVLSVPADLLPRLRLIAEPLVASIDASTQKGIEARARKLELFLRESGQFSYTLQMDVIDRRIDPVEDFLVNRKKGHCEYFASALALLLRSVGIPSRVVNGFKGGDWNELTETMNVRQKHAHSWVEAYIGLSPGTDRAPIWITLDPTPASERQESIAHVGGIAGTFRPLTDAIRHIWVFYVVGFDGERQNRLLYAPMRALLQEIRNQYVNLGELLGKWFKRLFHFRDIGAFISIRGFVVTFVVLTLASGLVMLAIRVGQRVLSWIRGHSLDATSLTAGILCYRRLVQVLAAYELKRNPAETQSEFARRAQKFLIGRGPTTQFVADVPERVVDAFYRDRFGHLELESASLEELDARLDALETSLKSR